MAHPEDAKGAGPNWHPKGPVSIRPAQRFDHEQIPGNQGDLPRQHHRQQHGGKKFVAARKAALGKGKTGERTKEEHANCADSGDIEAVEERAAKADLLKKFAIGARVKAIFRPELRGAAKERRITHKGADKHAVKGQNEDRCEDEQHDIEQNTLPNTQRIIVPRQRAPCGWSFTAGK